MCHVSRVTCHVSHFFLFIFLFFIFFLNFFLAKWWSLSVEGLLSTGLPRLVYIASTAPDIGGMVQPPR